MLTGREKRFLRKEAHTIQPIFQVGKGGINPNMVKQIAEALESRELIKVSILQSCDEPKQKVAETLSARTASEVVQLIGNTIVLYKKSKNKRTIELPKM